MASHPDLIALYEQMARDTAVVARAEPFKVAEETRSFSQAGVAYAATTQAADRPSSPPPSDAQPQA